MGLEEEEVVLVAGLLLGIGVLGVSLRRPQQEPETRGEQKFFPAIRIVIPQHDGARALLHLREPIGVVVHISVLQKQMLKPIVDRQTVAISFALWLA